MQLYILVNGEQQGPFSVDQIKGYLAIGQFQHTDLAWREGMPDWKPLSDFPEFAQRGHRTPNYGGMAIRKMAPTKKSGRGKGIVTAILTVVILGALGAGGYFGWQYWREHHKSAGADTSAAATQSEFVSSAAGIPKTPAELNRWYEEPPAGQNAAAVFRQGFDTFQITDADKASGALPLIGKAQLPSVANPVSGALRNAMKSFLDRNQSALDAFEKGAQISASRYPIDLTQGFNTTLPDLARVKSAAQVAALYAVSQADARNGTNAARGVALALAAARTLEAEPVLISQLTRLSAVGIAVDALEQAVNRAALPPESLTQLQTAFDRAANYETTGKGVDRALVGERVMSLATYDQSPERLQQTMLQAGVTNAPTVTPEKILGNLKEQRKFSEESYDQLLNARKDPFPARLKSDDLMTSRANEGRSKEYWFVAMTLPALGKVAGREGVGLARLRFGQVAVALERYRSANGNQYPNALTDLQSKIMPSLPADPFDGQALRYQKTATGYVLRSVGVDAKDDGAVRKMGSDDLWFTVVRPPKAL